jgi:hypothetical protein
MGTATVIGLVGVTVPRGHQRDGLSPDLACGSPPALVAKAMSVTFEWCAVEYMETYEAGWRNVKRRA